MSAQVPFRSLTVSGPAYRSTCVVHVRLIDNDTALGVTGASGRVKLYLGSNVVSDVELLDDGATTEDGYYLARIPASALGTHGTYRVEVTASRVNGDECFLETSFTI